MIRMVSSYVFLHHIQLRSGKAYSSYIPFRMVIHSLKIIHSHSFDKQNTFSLHLLSRGDINEPFCQRFVEYFIFHVISKAACNKDKCSRCSRFGFYCFVYLLEFL